MVSETSFKALFTNNGWLPSGCPREPIQTDKLVHCNRPLANCGCKYTYQMRYIVHDHCTRWHIHSRRDVSARRAIARRKVVVYTFHPLDGRLGSPKTNTVDGLDKRIFLTHNKVVFLLFKRSQSFRLKKTKTATSFQSSKLFAILAQSQSEGPECGSK